MSQAISGRFRGLYHIDLGSGVDLNGPDPVTRVSSNGKKLVTQAISGRYRGLYHTVLRTGVDLNGSGPRNTAFIKSSKTSGFRPFLSVFVGAHSFGLRGGFKRSGPRITSFI